MLRFLVIALAVSVSASTTASAQQWVMAYPAPSTPRMVVVAPPPPPMRYERGRGLFQSLFGDDGSRQVVMAPPPAAYRPQPRYVPSPQYGAPPRYAAIPPMQRSPAESMPQRHGPGFRLDSRYLPQEVAYHGKEAPGTIIVDTPHHFLYLVQDGGRARRYGIGVARSGFAWSGVHKITAKKKWPDWYPPKDMLARQPYLPHKMAGGPNNPLGARALYIGHTLYRIHGSNEPWTIGHNVSSGCIRMANQEVVDLYPRVKVGTKVVIIGPTGSARDYIPPPTTNPNAVEQAADARPPLR
ncbi:MAG: L,D-transpeptidase [Pseudolabrys sp.]